MGPGSRKGETITGGFWSALDAGTGDFLWENAGTSAAIPAVLDLPPEGAIAMNQGPVTIAIGVMFSGAPDDPGTMYAFDAAEDNILWSLTSGAFVNKGAAIVNSVVCWPSGYSSLGATAGNHLYAFRVPSLKQASLENDNILSTKIQEQFILLLTIFSHYTHIQPFNTKLACNCRIAATLKFIGKCRSYNKGVPRPRDDIWLLNRYNHCLTQK